MKSVFIDRFEGRRFKLKSFNILKYFPVNNESLFLKGSNFAELKLKL